MIIPLLIEQLLQVVVGLADTLMVSYAGEATVSGVAGYDDLHYLYLSVYPVATGGAVVVSQYLGSGDRRNANLAASQIFHINTVLSAACTMIMLLLGNAVLSGLYGSVEPEVMDACRIYLRIVTLSFPANAVYNAGVAWPITISWTYKTSMILYLSFGNISNHKRYISDNESVLSPLTSPSKKDIILFHSKPIDLIYLY